MPALLQLRMLRRFCAAGSDGSDVSGGSDDDAVAADIVAAHTDRHIAGPH